MKKTLSLFLTVMLLCAVFGQTTVNAENDYLWLEAEDAVFNGFSETENENASDGKLLSIYEKNSPEIEYSAVVSLDVQNNGKYDIWVLASSPTSNNVSTYKWRINDTEAVAYNSTDEQVIPVYTQAAGAKSYDVSWSRPAKNVTLSEGENTFTFSIDEKASSGMRRYLAFFDCIVAVPSAWEWQPDETLDKPVAVPAEYAWIELENPSNDTIFQTGITELASGGEILAAYGLSTGNDEGVAVVNYDFKVDNDTEYDIWYLGCTTGVAHLSTMKWDMDSDDPEKTAVKHNVVQETDNPTILKSTNAGDKFDLYWQKMGAKKLSGGNHTLNLVYYNRSMSKAVFTWADCVAVVPSSWNWQPGEYADGIHPSYDIAYLDAEFVYRQYFNEDYSAVTENISIPEGKIKTAGKSTITFNSEDENIISNNGEVRRPFFDEGTKSVNFNICASAGDKTVVYPVPITVPKQEKYAISDFKLTNSENINATNLIGGETLTASVDMALNTSENSDISGSASLIAVLYDENGVLEKAVAFETEITNIKKNVKVDLTLPDTVSGRSLKVFLLNNIKSGNMLADEISLKN